MYLNYFDEVKVGDKLVTRGRTITEADIINYCGLSGDWYPLHTDVEYCKTTPFKERIAHGPLVIAAASGAFVSEIHPDAIVAFYGWDKVRFVGPTKIGDTIHIEAEITDKEPRKVPNEDGGGVVTINVLIKNQRGETCVASIWKLFMRNKR